MLSLTLLLLLSVGCQSFPGQQITFTFVTALWAPSLEQDQGPVSHARQLQLLDLLLKTDENVIIFGEEELMKRVMPSRPKNNTVFVAMSLEELHRNPSSAQVRAYLSLLLQQDPSTYSKYSNEPQFRSSEFASIMFSKPFLLRTALSYDVFNSDYIYWIEPDILANSEYTASGPGFFTRKHNMLRKLSMHFQLPFIVRSGSKSNLAEGFKGGAERYGNVSTFAVAEWFGGRVQAIPSATAIYEDLLRTTLGWGDFWTHESLFSLMIHRYPKLITEVNSLHPGGLYHFDINGFIYRPIREVRHSRIVDGENSTLRFTSIGQRPAPIYTTTIKTYENFYEYELLMKSFQFRADRERLFLACLLFIYVVVRLLKFGKYGEPGREAVALAMEEQGSN